MTRLRHGFGGRARLQGLGGQAVTVALAAFALFTLEPFVGKVLLPRLGGTPMVWNTCVMVFQALLLSGYLYSVWLARHPRARRLHLWLSIATVVTWPVSVRLLWLAPPDVAPVLWVTAVISAAVGLAFVVLSATSPLMQVWAGQAGATTTAHRLYSVSNMASVGALVAYVVVVEPLMGLRSQAVMLWGLLALVAVTSQRVSIGTPWVMPAGAASPTLGNTSGVSAFVQWQWAALSFAASLVLYAVNTYLATDVASFPLLFIVPLALFLLGFAAGFSGWAERWGRAIEWTAMVAAMAALWYLLRLASPSSSASDLPWPLLALAGLVTALATRLAAARPTDEDLPRFYTMMGVGGLAAGVVAVLVVPWSWTSLSAPFHDSRWWLAQASVPEYPLALVVAMALVPRGWLLRIVPAAALVLLVTSTSPTYGMGVLFQARNFFGTIRVQDDPSASTHRLKNGTTLHGFEVVTEDIRQPTSYYHPASPIGQVMRRVHPSRVTAFGLGTGTLAAYARRGDAYTFLEINPLVVEIASDPRYFAYLTQARQRGAEIDIRVGDGRLEAAKLPDHESDLIVLDAFSSDSIPVHLVTAEAFTEYARALAPGGAIAVHVSNRFFDLGPSVAATAEAVGLDWFIQSRTEEEPDESRSTWVMLVADEDAAERWGLASKLGSGVVSKQLPTPISPIPPWRHPVVPKGVSAWTDDWANLLGRLRVLANWQNANFD